MNLRQFEILRAVMRCRTTIGAAHELGMSQPAVSNAIKHAESQIGYLLFDRINNRLVPTEEAKLLFDGSEPLFLMYEALRQKALDLGAGKAGRLRILATSELSESLVPRVLPKFLSQHPQVKVSVDILSLEGVLEGIETGAADVGLAMEPAARPSLAFDPLGEIEMICACPAGSALAKLPMVTPRDLADERLIIAPTHGRIHHLVQDAFHRAKARFEPDLEIRFMNVAARCVQAGVGVALVDFLTASFNVSPAIVFRPFQPRIPIVVNAILTKDRPPQRLAKKFVQYARAELSALQANAATERTGAIEASTPPAAE